MPRNANSMHTLGLSLANRFYGRIEIWIVLAFQMLVREYLEYIGECVLNYIVAPNEYVILTLVNPQTGALHANKPTAQNVRAYPAVVYHEGYYFIVAR